MTRQEKTRLKKKYDMYLFLPLTILLIAFSWILTIGIIMFSLSEYELSAIFSSIGFAGVVVILMMIFLTDVNLEKKINDEN